jgi:sugar/nucleoside kinase (ribokinase family)
MPIRGKLGRPVDFVGVGHVAVDFRDGERVLGGAAAYACLTAARLGLTASIVTAVGRDFDLFGPLEGIEIHYRQSVDSTTFDNDYRGGERHQRLSNRALPIREQDIATIRSGLAEDAAVLYCPIAQEVEAPLNRLTQHGRCGVAPQGFFRRWDDDGAVQQCAWQGAAAALTEADLVSMSQTDPPAGDLADLVNLVGLTKGLAGGKATLAITQGERGARIYTKGHCYLVPAFERSVQDPTGAGDVFAAGFLVALREGQETIDAAQFATCAASFAVEKAGVTGVPPNREAVEARLSEYRAHYQPQELEP